MLCKLEEAGARMQKSGLSQKWFGTADQEILNVAGKCNGHLFEQLLLQSNYHDVDCVNLLREGTTYSHVVMA